MTIKHRKALCFATMGVITAVLITLRSGKPNRGTTVDVQCGFSHGSPLFMDVFQPAWPSGAGVLFILSGGWRPLNIDPDSFRPIIQPLLDAGITVFAVRHGAGPEYRVPDTVADVRQAARFVRDHALEYGVDPHRIGAMGSSSGGHLALMLGTSGEVSAVVAWCPPTDICPWVNRGSAYYKLSSLVRFDATQASLYCPLLRVNEHACPTMLIQGEMDLWVPIEQVRNMEIALRNCGVRTELLVFKGAGHIFAGGDLEEAQRATVRWFKLYLQRH